MNKREPKKIIVVKKAGKKFHELSTLDFCLEWMKINYNGEMKKERFVRRVLDKNVNYCGFTFETWKNENAK